MARQEVQPVVTTKERSYGPESKIEHPAFGMIGASRVNGRFNLYGSHVGHGGAVKITLQTAYTTDDGHHERHYADKIVSEVYLSEAQWVAFVSRLNLGDGVPCTLRYYRDGDLVSVPGLPDSDKAAEKIAARAQAMLDASQKRQNEAYAKARSLLDASGLSAKKREEILNAMAHMHDHGQSNRDYQRRVLQEDTERLVTEAKVEIDAMVSAMARQLGVESMGTLIKAFEERQGLLEDQTPEGEGA